MTVEVSRLVGEALDSAVAATRDGALALAEFTVDQWGRLSQWTASSWAAAKSWSADVWQDVQETGTYVLDKTLEYGGALIRNIGNAAEAAADAVTSLVGDAVDWLFGDETEDYNLTGGAESERWILGRGNDIFNPGGGFDEVFLGPGHDTVKGLPGDLDGLKIRDFTDDDWLILSDAWTSSWRMGQGPGFATVDLDTDDDGQFDTTIRLDGEIDPSEARVSRDGSGFVIRTRGSSVGIADEGSDENDTIPGSPGNDIVRGKKGNDRLHGLGGNDTLDGGADYDLLDGGADDDALYGGAGNDRLEGRSGNDHGSGGSGDDIIVTGTGNDTFRGWKGDDEIYAISGNNTLRGDDG
ncbi:calcium-binding protein, partial [Roseisalinus antarcticus]|uniref:calcium-binding protein n=1 Tax=Roseisalinus antarcticus TaxID=254357 RepID=UPI00351FFB10